MSGSYNPTVVGTIPLQPVPSQTVNVTLNNQACTINVYEKELAAQQFLLTTDTGEIIVSSQDFALDVTPDTFPVPRAVFLDLYILGNLLVGGVPCLNGVLIVRDSYFNFLGDLVFYDLQGLTDPVSSGLGSRYVLAYVTNVP